MLCPLAGCTALNLMEGKLPAGSEDEQLTATQSPFPWENKDAKATLNRIPRSDQKQPEAPAAAPPVTTNAKPPVEPTAAPASSAPAATNVNANVTLEQAPAQNPAVPAVPAGASNSQQLALVVEPRPPVAPPASSVNPPPVHGQVSTPPAAATPGLGHPTPRQPLAVPGAEGTPVTPPPANGDKKPEPTAAERLSALMKQRSEFLTALKSEVNRRRSSTDDSEELTRLEKELRLVQLAGEQPDEAVRQIDALDGPERDAFAHLLMGLATWMNADEARRPTLRNAKIVREIRDAAAELAAASKLDVRNLAFCEKIEGYGWYTEFTKNHFKPKQEVLLYTEVENFTAIRIANETYETELQGSYQIFDSQSKLVDEREVPLDLEQCRNYRKDYFLAYRIYLPEGLTSGKYRLELTIEDKKILSSHSESATRPGVKEDKVVKTPSSASSFKGRKLGTGTIEFTIK